MTAHYLVIVGTSDNPIYEIYLGKDDTRRPKAGQITSFSVFGNGIDNANAVGYNRSGDDTKHVVQLIAHSALDVIEDSRFTSSAMYLKNIDQFHEWNVSAWLTAGGAKIILLHQNKNEDGNRLFLQDVWELYTKAILNPFYEVNAPITSDTFDRRVRAAAQKYL